MSQGRGPHQFIFLNGPPKSGKDLAAEIIRHEMFYAVRDLKMSALLKAGVAAIYGMSSEQVKEIEKPGNNDLKNEASEQFFGLSYREALIAMSEKHMKVLHGETVFGRLLLRRVQEPTSYKISTISDSGFAGELLPIAGWAGPNNCHVFRLRRPGCDFTSDSRSYLTAADLPNGVQFVDIDNRHDRAMYRIQIMKQVYKLLGDNRPVDYE